MSILTTPRTKGILLTTLGIIAASPDGLFMRLAHMDPWTVIFCRGLMLAFAINLWVRISTGRHSTAAWWAAGRWDWVLSLSFAFTGLCFLLALSMTTVANVLVMTGLAPMVTALIGMSVLGEKVDRKTWVAIATCILGAGVIAFGETGGTASDEPTTSLVGILLGFLSAFFISMQTIACRKSKHANTSASVVAGALLAALIAMPFASPLQVEAPHLAWIGGMGLILMPAAIILVFTGTHYINAYEVVIISLLEVVLGPLLVWLFLGEMPSAHTFSGGAMIFLGVIFCFWPRTAARAATPAPTRVAE